MPLRNQKKVDLKRIFNVVLFHNQNKTKNSKFAGEVEIHEMILMQNQIQLKNTGRKAIFKEIENYLSSLKLKVVSKDLNRPWGGFFVIDEQQAQQFAAIFFPGIELSALRIRGKLSSKVLVIEPEKRLSWQYHNRRAEIWRCLSSKVKVVTSFNDEEQEIHTLQAGDEIRLAQGQIHRLVGLKEWGVIAEIWQHTDQDHPSDEEDIIRLQDDFGR